MTVLGILLLLLLGKGLLSSANRPYYRSGSHDIYSRPSSDSNYHGGFGNASHRPTETLNPGSPQHSRPTGRDSHPSGNSYRPTRPSGTHPVQGNPSNTYRAPEVPSNNSSSSGGGSTHGGGSGRGK
ncbi:MAG: hypothetical protein K5629_00495 [Eubacteriales bacterium]|nr:hypothetical protein [Eubacteriales bacterium]